MKRERGITLIALVITIIVLLILAGVSISLVVGDNGVLNQATNAVSKNREAAAKEEVQMAWASATSEYWADLASNTGVNKEEYFTAEKLTTYTGGENGTGTIKSSDPCDDGTYIVVYESNDQNRDRTYIIDENGNLEELKGNAKEICETENYIGATVNYPKTYSDIGSGSGWEIFYADKKYVYIITKGSLNPSILSIEGYNGTSDFENIDVNKFPAIVDGWLSNVYSGGKILYDSQDYANMKATEYLLDSTNEKWSGLKDNTYAKWIIGAPTFELFLASYNKKNPNQNNLSLNSVSGYRLFNKFN